MHFVRAYFHSHVCPVCGRTSPWCMCGVSHSLACCCCCFQQQTVYQICSHAMRYVIEWLLVVENWAVAHNNYLSVFAIAHREREKESNWTYVVDWDRVARYRWPVNCIYNPIHCHIVQNFPNTTHKHDPSLSYSHCGISIILTLCETCSQTNKIFSHFFFIVILKAFSKLYGSIEYSCEFSDSCALLYACNNIGEVLQYKFIIWWNGIVYDCIQ